MRRTRPKIEGEKRKKEREPGSGRKAETRQNSQRTLTL